MDLCLVDLAVTLFNACSSSVLKKLRDKLCSSTVFLRAIRIPLSVNCILTWMTSHCRTSSVQLYAALVASTPANSQTNFSHTFVWEKLVAGLTICRRGGATCSWMQPSARNLMVQKSYSLDKVYGSY